MVVKMTNKHQNFYQYMGKFFGSRLVEKQTNDRIYDDDNKEWYIFFEREKVMAFVSVSRNVIKNIYTTKETYLEAILCEIRKETNITYSIVTNYYKEIYKKCGFKIYAENEYKNFITIYTEKKKEKALI